MNLNSLAIDCAPRVLSLLNRNQHSQAFGCFDKQFWHFKTKDFASSTNQMGAEYLARLWSLNIENNPYYNDLNILVYAKAAFNYTFTLQHQDGSFDEWYPNEHGWAGPTSYVIHSLYSAYGLIKNHLNKEEKQTALSGFEKAGRFLIQRDEHDVLANHFALYLLSLAEINQLVAIDEIEIKFYQDINKFFQYTSKEGWSLEYDGVDFSYNIATLSFFARLNQIYKNEKIESYCLNSINFLSHFVFPDGTIASGFGSRNTKHLYPYAFLYWSQKSKTAESILKFLLDKKSFEIISPATQDDHYLFYRLNEFLELDQRQVDAVKKIEDLPCERHNTQKSFDEAQLEVKSIEKHYVAINEKKGGAICIYNQENSECLIKNFGWIIKNQNNRLYSCFWSHAKLQIVKSPGKIEISGAAREVTEVFFNPVKLILFRIFSLFAFNSVLAYYLKRLIRSLLITKQKESKYRFNRNINFLENGIEIKDTLYNLSPTDTIFWGGEFSNRYVPQSNYYENGIKYFKQKQINASEGSLVISQIYYFDGKHSEVCVE